MKPARIVLIAALASSIALSLGRPSIVAEEGTRGDDNDKYIGSFYHMGIWVEDLDEMTGFLSLVMDLTLLTRVERATGGERLILEDARGQRIELLSDPSAVVAHPEFPLHPQGRVAGIAHIAIQVDDVIRLRDLLTAKGYPILAQAPTDYADGYISSEVSEHRILFIAGPSGVTFELFEIR
jgi:catechol 2,3-dioxygenase-like lactoylglutathione lyase family enzyme